MNIVHIHWSLATGGTETMLVDIINEQVNNANTKINLVIINNDIYPPLLKKIDKRCNIFFLNRKIKSKNPWPLIKLNVILLKIRPDIIHIHAQRIVKCIYVPYIKIRTIHSVLNDKNEYNQYKALFCISEAVKEFTKLQGFPNTITIMNGININNIKPSEKAVGKTVKILQVSRLCHQQKGQHILVDAIDILVNQRNVYNITLDFIGEGESLPFLQQKVCDAGLENIVHFLGQRDRDYIYSNLCHYNLYVQPSISEGFGLTIVEAMSAKLPIIISDIAAPMEIIEHGKFGKYFKSENSLELANLIEDFIKNGYDDEMIQKAYSHVKNTFDVSITAKRYIEEYKKLCTCKK